MTTEGDTPEEGNLPTPRQASGEILPRRANIGKNMVDGSRVYFNLGQRVIITTRDRLKLTLIETVPRYSDLGVLLGKVGIFAALVLAILTTDTKEKFGVSAEAWSVVLVLTTIVAGVWTAREAYLYFTGKTIDDIVDAVVDDDPGE